MKNHYLPTKTSYLVSYAFMTFSIEDHNHLTIKTFMAIMAERDAAIQERNLALDERKRAFAERDMAMLQRDAALAERNSAMQERDNAIATLRFQGTTFLTTDLPETLESNPTFTNQDHPTFQKTPKISKSRKRAENIKDEFEFLNHHVSFDELGMRVPVCSCTGVPQPCYRWGSGGWQSACCTTTMSMYPLPQVSNKKYSRVGGRKMSGGAFSKLLTRLASEGYDLSIPLDLKDHWAKHGTNRYTTLK